MEKRKREDTALGFLVIWWTTSKPKQRVAIYAVLLAELLMCLLIATWVVSVGVVAGVVCLIVDLVFFALALAD